MSPLRARAAMSAASLLCCCAAAAQTTDWPHWRGPRFDGSSPETGLPQELGPDRDVRWRTDLPGPSAATPIVVGDAVFLTAAVPGEQALLALCVDRATGAVRWSDRAGSGYRAGDRGDVVQLHPRSNYASPSPVADDQRVVFFFGNGDLVAYTHAGERQWARNLQRDYGDFCFQWTFSASPTLFDGKLFLQVLQRDEQVDDVGRPEAGSYLLALDPATGETLWKHARPSDARKESLESYATPIPVLVDGQAQLLVVGGDVLTGHSPADGRELWRWGTWNEGHREEWWRVVPTPVSGAGVAVACGPKGAAVVGVKLGGSGLLGDDGVAWRKDGRGNPVTTDVPTPLFYDGRFYVLSDLRNALTALDARTGETAWKIDLPREALWRASPTGADGCVWIMNHRGDVLVVDAAGGAVRHTASLGREDDDGIRSSLVVAHGALFARTNVRLWCFARTPAGEER